MPKKKNSRLREYHSVKEKIARKHLRVKRGSHALQKARKQGAAQEEFELNDEELHEP